MKVIARNIHCFNNVQSVNIQQESIMTCFDTLCRNLCKIAVNLKVLKLHFCIFSESYVEYLENLLEECVNLEEFCLLPHMCNLSEKLFDILRTKEKLMHLNLGFCKGNRISAESNEEFTFRVLLAQNRYSKSLAKLVYENPKVSSSEIE